MRLVTLFTRPHPSSHLNAFNTELVCVGLCIGWPDLQVRSFCTCGDTPEKVGATDQNNNTRRTKVAPASRFPQRRGVKTS